MAIFVLTSVSGAPGVTTTALGLAQQWGSRHAILLDADPVGGAAILAGHFQGRVVNPGTMVELWMGHRQGRLAETLSESALTLGEGIDFIPGAAGAAQASTIAGLWPALGVELKRMDALDIDVIVDYGRVGHAGSAEALLRMADQVIVVMRSDLVSVAAVAAMPALDTPVGLAVVGPGRPYTAAAITKAMKFPVEIELPWSPKEAAVLSHGAAEPRIRPWRRPPQVLAQRLRTAAEGLRWRAEARMEELHA
ncbi:P-loop NTPase family protein [Tessaracoccus antarcticus]|uniref:ParA family protein n=1 Tax=Tessaracoccus antarcticus TaxID=2479848 RepID=A0A3M0FWN7_9ACTN|nr:hypothetical protein [Tessaracoccus antarcticus]RMB56868.1 hypothetical protein EAX62_16455 [Tessaracoccus antarcticus]